MTSRKFLLTLLVFLTSTGLLIAHLIGADEWKSIAVLTLGMYIAGNVAQKATEKTPT